MGAVHVEGAAAVARHQFDRLPRGNRASKDGLVATCERRDLLCAIEVRDDPEYEQKDADDDGERNENAHHGAHQVNPEVADLLGLVLRKSADQRHADTHSHRPAGERLNAEAREQPDVPERRFSGIVLPAGIRHERNRGVERQRRRHALVAPRLRQLCLHQQQPVQEQHADGGECQHRSPVLRPPLPVVGLSPDQPVDQLFNAPMPGVGIDPGHVVAQWHMQDHQENCDSEDLQPCGCRPL